MKSIGGYFSCTSCLHPGGTATGNTTQEKLASIRQLLPEQCCGVHPRTRENFKLFGYKAFENTKASNSKQPCAVSNWHSARLNLCSLRCEHVQEKGVLHQTALLALPYFDPARYCAPDPMHLLGCNLLKDLTKFWIVDGERSRPCSIGERKKDHNYMHPNALYNKTYRKGCNCCHGNTSW